MSELDVQAPYYSSGYSPGDAGYVVKNEFTGCREASFVCQEAAQDYAIYANRMLEKHGTTEIAKWKGGK